MVHDRTTQETVKGESFRRHSAQFSTKLGTSGTGVYSKCRAAKAEKRDVTRALHEKAGQTSSRKKEYSWPCSLLGSRRSV